MGVHGNGRSAQDTVHRAVHTMLVGSQEGDGIRIGMRIKGGIYRYPGTLHTRHTISGMARDKGQSESHAHQKCAGASNIGYLHCCQYCQKPYKGSHKMEGDKGVPGFFQKKRIENIWVSEK